jgi:hypothetical protein
MGDLEGLGQLDQGGSLGQMGQMEGLGQEGEVVGLGLTEPQFTNAVLSLKNGIFKMQCLV